jgi:hypothetical protein
LRSIIDQKEKELQRMKELLEEQALKSFKNEKVGLPT